MSNQPQRTCPYCPDGTRLVEMESLPLWTERLSNGNVIRHEPPQPYWRHRYVGKIQYSTWAEDVRREWSDPRPWVCPDCPYTEFICKSQEVQEEPLPTERAPGGGAAPVRQYNR